MKRTIMMAVVLSLGLLGMLWGCSKEEPIPASPPPPLQKPSVVKQQPMSSAQVTASAPLFDFSTRRDPFKPAIVEVKKPDEKHTKVKGTLPIQNFDLGQFRVTGIIVGLKENFAQVVDPTGKAYTLKKGMVIGTNNGRVVAITSTYIEVAERVVEDSGKVKTRTERLVIPKKSQGEGR
jgi:type IV pilus assembly protein PilP